mgnify:CR=1 FL=1
MKDIFRKVSTKISNAVGTAGSFFFALMIVVVWALTGSLFNYSDTWQLVINTGTTIVTFLMVFLIQNTQNRDSKALHLKLDELIRSSGARNKFVDLEDLTDSELELIDEQFKKLHDRENQPTNPAMHKLHEKIVDEKERRMSLRKAGSAIKHLVEKPFEIVTKKHD